MSAILDRLKIPENATSPWQAHDLLRSNSTGELILCPQFKSGLFIGGNPSFSIVGINLPAAETVTPYGQIGAVLE